MGKEKRGPLALELWAKQLVDSYPGVCIQNMTTSWRNGMAFAALIHRFRPDLIEFDKLDPSDILGNCSLAFEVAESKLGIPSLLDPIDMQAMDVPDRLSVLTYVAQFYNLFKNAKAKPLTSSKPRSEENDENDDSAALKKRPSENSVTPSPEKKVFGKRKNSTTTEDEIMDKVKRSLPNNSVLLSTAKLCCECNNPVFISERVLFMNKVYHRSCLRCSVCKSPVNPHIGDISSDGSLYCLETTCHTELIKKQSEGSSKSMTVESPDISFKESRNCALVNLSKLRDANEEKPVAVDMTGDEENSRNNALQIGPSEQARTEDVDVISAITPVTRKRLLDFVGGLLHMEGEDRETNIKSRDESCDQSVLVDKSNSSKPPTKEDDISLIPNPTPEIVIVANTIHSGLPEVKSPSPTCDKELPSIEVETSEKCVKSIGTAVAENSDHSNLKRTEERTSLRDEKVVLTVADQIKVSLPITSADNDESPQESLPCDGNNLNSSALKETEKANHESQQSEPEKEDNENESPSHVSSVEVPTKVPEKDHVPRSEPEPEPQNPFEEEGEEAEKPATEESILAQPSPKPRRPPKPPPPTLSHESPSPTPRNRTDMKKTPSVKEGAEKDDYYPPELNPFESEEDQEVKPSTNPFEDDLDEEEVTPMTPTPKPRSQKEVNNNKGILENSPSNVKSKNAANFNVPPPRPPPPVVSPRKVIQPPKEYNPFEEEDDIGEYDNEDISVCRRPDDSSSISSKTSGMSSISGVPTPTPRSLNTSDTEGMGSLKVRSRKSRRAPLPPSMTSSQKNLDLTPTVQSPLTPSTERKLIPASPKLLKGLSHMPGNSRASTPRKKRRAPPPRRQVEPLPEAAIKTEFADLEIKLKELERQGISLETKIRSVEDDDNEEGAKVEVEGTDESLPTEHADELMVQLWNIVHERNEILRRQTELEYLRRGHRLEEMQSDLEFKLRVLMETPENQKPPNYADMEQVLLAQLLKLVDERNEVVEWFDYHRQLDREEDMLLSKSITEFTQSNSTPDESIASSSKEKSKDKKAKDKDKSKEEKKKKSGKLKIGLFKKSKKSKEADLPTDP